MKNRTHLKVKQKTAKIVRVHLPKSLKPRTSPTSPPTPSCSPKLPFPFACAASRQIVQTRRFIFCEDDASNQHRISPKNHPLNALKPHFHPNRHGAFILPVCLSLSARDRKRAKTAGNTSRTSAVGEANGEQCLWIQSFKG